MLFILWHFVPETYDHLHLLTWCIASLAIGTVVIARRLEKRLNAADPILTKTAIIIVLQGCVSPLVLATGTILLKL